MELHSGEQVIFEGHPSWRSILSFYLKALLLAAAAIVIAALVGDTGVIVLVAVVALAAVIVIGLIKRIATTYTITNERLHIRRGIVARRTQETRLERVQNVNSSQSVIERLLRVGTVDFDTAGGDDYEFQFAGVAQPEKVVAAVDQARRSLPQSATDSV